MILANGTRVKLKYTGDEGVVSALLGDGMVQVLLNDGDEIPVALEDLIRPEEIRKGVKAKVVQIPKPPKPEPPAFPEAIQQYAVLKSMGIQLGFLGEINESGMTDHYKMYLINDTSYDSLFSFGLSYSKQDSHHPKINDKIGASAVFLLGELPFSALNDLPEVEIECWQITTAGTGKRLHKKIKIKPKQFFNNVLTAPILNKPVHHYRVFASFDTPKEEKEEDLKAYTKRNVRTPRPAGYAQRDLSKNEIAEYASFDSEIDLHIENLTSQSVKKMTNAEILRIQLKAFQDYLRKAIQLKMDRVFIIHGLGKGKLRNEIATRLMKHPDVVTFKNEYHAKYGYGATEVILK